MSTDRERMKYIDRYFLNAQAIIDRRIVAAYREAAEAVYDEIQKVYRSYDLPKATGPETMKAMQKMSNASKSRLTRLQALHASINEQVQPLLTAMDKWTVNQIENIYVDSFYLHGWDISQAARVSVSYGALSSDAVKAAVMNPISKLSDSTAMMIQRKYTVQNINNAVTQGIMQGKGYADVTKKIDVVLGIRDPKTGKLYKRAETGKKGESYKSLRVARTEGQRAQSEGQTDAYEKAREMGVNGARVWVASPADGGRDHQSMQGQKEDKNGMFTLPSGIQTRAPLMSGDPSEDINCKCSTRFEIEGLEPKLKRMQGREVWKYQDAEEWMKAGNYKAMKRAA